jgi:xanthine/uracil permease
MPKIFLCAKICGPPRFFFAGAPGGSFGLPKYWTIALIVLAVMLACSFFAKRRSSFRGMLAGIAVGYAIALALGVSTASCG